MRLVLPIIALSFAACTSSTGDDTTDNVNCATETRADNFIVGLEKPGMAGLLDFTLMSANPSEPAQGDNDWTVQIKTMTNGVAGSTVTGATIHAAPYMPDHMHTSPIKVVTTDKGDGSYDLARVNLWMPGLWQTTIQVDSAAASDTVVFSVCIPN